MFFQTKSGSSTYYSVFVLKLMREIFVAYAISKSSLAFPIGKSTKALPRRSSVSNDELQRRLSYAAELELSSQLG
jgi:hypothetical protein